MPNRRGNKSPQLDWIFYLASSLTLRYSYLLLYTFFLLLSFLFYIKYTAFFSCLNFKQQDNLFDITIIFIILSTLFHRLSNKTFLVIHAPLYFIDISLFFYKLLIILLNFSIDIKKPYFSRLYVYKVFHRLSTKFIEHSKNHWHLSIYIYHAAFLIILYS